MGELNIAWFRRDLRLHDNPMLAAAAHDGDVAGLFVIDPRLVAGRRASGNRNAFLRASLAELREALRVRGGELIIREGRPEEVVPGIAQEISARAIFASRDYTPFARRRDAAAGEALRGVGVAFEQFPGPLVVEPEDIANADGGYKTFGAFYRRWAQAPGREMSPPPAKAGTTAHLAASGEIPDDDRFVASATELPRAGEGAARERLWTWVDEGLRDYAGKRDLPGSNATSRLSQDLHFGLISALEVINAVEAANVDAERFVAEVAWRDFYHHMAWHNPRVVHQPYRQEFAGIRWESNQSHFDAWAAGRTGYPMVDAGMRELLATGYMHNRARMITASFLVKDLLLDWREGEAHFLRHLVDGDIANNNGGWQWSASTGADAPPYFRIFNPVRQGERFDPRGEYVRRWVPELGRVPDKQVHSPWHMPDAVQRKSGCVIGEDYPAPIVDHAMARRRALDAYAEAKEREEGY